MIFWRKIVIFHTKYPKIFAPPFARRIFFKCAPPNLKSWIRPWNRKFEIRKKIKYIIISNLNVQSGWYTQYIIELFGELLCNDLNIQTDSMW